jgi:RNA polymerase sigma factor (sigma-70 family)
MSSMTVPPFERFYEQHRDEIYAFLAKRLGVGRAEDAFQETFLRALRAYPRLEHGDHLRAWVYTIAGRIAIDAHRRAPRPSAELPELGSLDGRPAYAELEHLAAELPPTERAAVVLRYGYDLAYAEIGEALGCSEEAARRNVHEGLKSLREVIAR